MVARTVSAPEPITTTTCSACGSPWYSTRWYWRPVSDAKRSITFCVTAGVQA